MDCPLAMLPGKETIHGITGLGCRRRPASSYPKPALPPCCSGPNQTINQSITSRSPNFLTREAKEPLKVQIWSLHFNSTFFFSLLSPNGEYRVMKKGSVFKRPHWQVEVKERFKWEDHISLQEKWSHFSPSYEPQMTPTECFATSAKK